MSTDEQKKQIEELLLKLDNAALRKSHNSVSISFTLFLNYIDKIRGAVPKGEIKTLLQTYWEMADKFYAQYELSLLENIAKQKDNDTAERETLINNFPTLLQNALDKLKDEWQRLHTIAAASQALEEDKKLVQMLNVVVETAAFTVGIEAERIAIVPGDAFALYFFTYLENFAVLTVPTYSVQAPWEWSIFWHELAGYKVRKLEKSTTITTIKENLKNLYQLYKKETDNIKKEKLISNSAYYENSQNYIRELFSTEEKFKLYLSDLGGFEHQFEHMLKNLPQKDGWCVDWFKELFEDAWSVLVFDDLFQVVMDDILSRHVSTDGRHPPKEVRIEVAQKLLKFKNGESDIAKPPETVEESAAQQIFKFIALITYASSYKYYESKGDELTKLLNDLDKRLTILVLWLLNIQIAIDKWSKILNSANTPTDQAVNDIIGGVIHSEGFDAILKMEKQPLAPSYIKLLKDEQGKPLDYKQLLALSFFERDFFSFKDITSFTCGLQTKSPGGTFIVPLDWNKDKGEVSYKYTDSSRHVHTYHTTKKQWNDFWENNDKSFQFK